MSSKKRLELDLSIWQRYMIGLIVRGQRLTMENSHRGHKILDAVNFIDAEAEAISFTIYPNGSASWNQKATNRYAIVLKGRPLIRWLKEVVEKFAGWPPDKYEESLHLRAQLGIIDEFDDEDEEDEIE